MLLRDGDKFMSELHLYTHTPVTLFCANETDESVDLVKLRRGIKYTTIPPGSTFKSRECFRDGLLILESGTKKRLCGRVRYVGGYLPRSRRTCHHVFVCIVKEISSLREISMSKVSKAGLDFQNQMIPLTLKDELSQMVEGRKTFLDQIDCVCVNRNYNPKAFHIELLLAF